MMFCLRMAMALLPLVLFSLYLPYLLQIIADQMTEQNKRIRALKYKSSNRFCEIDFPIEREKAYGIQ